MPRLSSLILANIVLLATVDATHAQQVYAAAALTTEGAGPLGVGALVGAVVAGAFALLERFRGR